MIATTPIPERLKRRHRHYRAVVAALAVSVAVLSAINNRLPISQAIAPVREAKAANGEVSTFAFFPYPTPRPVANVRFADGKGRVRDLASFRGKVVLLNVWATWCGPCRQEMPTLDRLQAKLGGKDFEVVALSIDRGGQAAVGSFFDETNVQKLAIYVDASTEAQGRLGIIGVPTSLLLDRQGREIGRVTGPAQWDSPEVIGIIKRYLTAPDS
ncbi:MAG: TlpA family protein disulfide reductase [Betaproteobacteria bacterium]|nr:TlpA family protein disulfide reductase [Betaproteobacteria bacterium]